MLDLDLTIEESLSDKPSFRWKIEDNEKEINDLEAILDKVAKSCKTFCDTGKAFCDSMGPFTEGISDLAKHFKADDEIRDAYTTFSEHLEEIKGFYAMLLVQAKRSILESLIEDMKKMLRDVKLHRKAFNEKSSELDAALNTNSAKVIRKKDEEQDAVQSLALLSTTKIEFHHTSVDYVNEISKLQLGKQFLITEKFLHLMYSFYSFFHQGHLTLQDIDPYLKNLNALMTKKQNQRDKLLKNLESRHRSVTELKSNKYDGLMITPKDEKVLLEGYLYKQSHNTFKTWKRRYFIIKTNQLHYQKRGKGKDEDNKVVSEDLRISQVRSTDEQDRRYCFELIMPTKKIFLQADSQKVKDAWIKSLQCGIEAAIHNTTSTNENDSERERKGGYNPPENIKSGNSEEILRLLDDIKNLPGNELCADCGSNEPVWASINLGVTLCILCSGIHRNLGVHISKVRSIELDIWELEQCLLMLRLGNNKVNDIYEKNVTEPYRKPVPGNSTVQDNETWIRAKYETKTFLENREYVQTKSRIKTATDSMRATSISYDPGAIHGGSLKLRPKRDSNNLSRPLSNIFQKINNRKKRGGSDGAAYIDTEHYDDEDERAMSPQYTALSTEEPVQQTTHTDSCVPEFLLSKSTLSADRSGYDLSATDGSNNLNLIGPLVLSNSLYKASTVADIDAMYRLLAEGGNINHHNSTDNDRTPLIQAVHANSREAVQLLVVNGVNMNQVDGSRQTALHHAVCLGYTDLACLLLKRGADHRPVNEDNKDALDIAVEGEKASLVTVLRFVRINGASDPTSVQLLAEFSKQRSTDQKH